MKNRFSLYLLCILIFSCNTKKTVITTLEPKKVWDFDELNEWQYASQTSNGVINYRVDNGNLRLFSHANTRDRTKVKTIEKFGAGIYTWKVFVPEMGVGDQTAIGAYLYKDDKHELDFEIGYGNKAIRKELEATEEDLIVYMTSQDNPSSSFIKTIMRNKWYTLSLELIDINGFYKVNWKIDDEIEHSVELNYGSSTRYKIFCSIENLPFIGDHIPTKNNYTLFNSVTFQKQ
jgi:hypothetical protein